MMANSSVPVTIDPTLTDESISALKQRIAALKEENVQLGNKISRSP
jgi:hypothetical protein